MTARHLVVAGLAVATLAACSTSAPSVSTKPVAAVPASTSSNSTGASPAKAHVGSTINLTGVDTTVTAAVTLVKVDPAATAPAAFTPAAGDRFYATQWRIVNTSKVSYPVAAEGDVTIMDGAGQSFQSDLESTLAGPSFSPTLQLTPGATALGWVMFDVPVGDTITGAQFAASYGAGSTGQWSIP